MMDRKSFSYEKRLECRLAFVEIMSCTPKKLSFKFQTDIE